MTYIELAYVELGQLLSMCSVDVQNPWVSHCPVWMTAASNRSHDGSQSGNVLTSL